MILSIAMRRSQDVLKWISYFLTSLAFTEGFIKRNHLFEVDVKNSPYYKDGIFNIPISDEHGNALYKHWVDQAFSSLMAAIATKKLQSMSTTERTRHHNCARKAKNLQAHAKCVSELLDVSAKVAKRNRWVKLLNKKRQRSLVNHSVISQIKSTPVIHARTSERNSLLRNRFHLRHKRTVASMSSYNITEEKDGSIFGRLARQLMKTVLTLKNKKTHRK
ncbi:hypothetical protein DICVIV_06910 [Dictyocaulus viviparus]|uniref:Uncharacterized protein n=1 Tax=Dictyocaulus viviparus TaxID=29172 RepID=A0A0D8XQS5_DICVI|nr:hypothetical protein DICVIV_06910 [Dictyocaulus viviparus]